MIKDIIQNADGQWVHTCETCAWSKTFPMKVHVNCPFCSQGKKRPAPQRVRIASQHVHIPAKAKPIMHDGTDRPKPKPLGDKVEEFLTSHGLTKEFYSHMKESIGLPPGCSCNSRQEWLNKWSERFPSVADMGGKLLDYLKKPQIKQDPSEL